MRGDKRKGTRYFGPYAAAWAIRETLDQLLRTFPVRTCSDSKLSRHAKLGRPCLLFHIEKCSGPCVGEMWVEAGLTKDISATAAFPFFWFDALRLALGLSFCLGDVRDGADRIARVWGSFHTI